MGLDTDGKNRKHISLVHEMGSKNRSRKKTHEVRRI